MTQTHRFLVFTLWIPHHKQFTLRNPLARLKVIYILPVDLMRVKPAMIILSLPQMISNIYWSFIYYFVLPLVILISYASYCVAHSGVSAWCYFPAILCDLSVFRNVQTNFTALKLHPKCGLLLCKLTIVLSDNLKYNRYGTKCYNEAVVLLQWREKSTFTENLGLRQ